MRKSLYGSFLLAFVFLIARTNTVTGAGSKLVFCYWGTWSYYRPGNGQYRVNNIDPSLCTHLGYAFMGLSDEGEIKMLDPWLDSDLGNINNTIALREKNPNLKILAAIGGWNEGSIKYSAMVSTKESRAKFIKSVLEFLIAHKFNGLDGDWEYPTQRGGSPNDRENFVLLLKELKIAFEPYGFLLSIAVAAGEEISNEAYDIPNISKYVDLINVMTYDFTGSTAKKAEFNAPLRGNGNLNVEYSIEYWLKNGAPAEKLLLGLAMYGHSFNLTNSSDNCPGAPVSGPGTAGPITQQAGVLAYSEICQNIQNGWTRKWDSKQLVPYAFQGDQWVGYDDPESFAHKIDYLKSKNLAGAMVWSLESDDFRGLCGPKNILLKTVNENLAKSKKLKRKWWKKLFKF